MLGQNGGPSPDQSLIDDCGAAAFIILDEQSTTGTWVLDETTTTQREHHGVPGQIRVFSSPWPRASDCLARSL